MKSTIAPFDDTPAYVLEEIDDDAPETTEDDAVEAAEGDDSIANRTPRELVKLTVTIDEDEFDHDIDRAFRKIGKEARLPGFRAGKVPRKVLEARIGLAAAREEALRDALPNYLAMAVREHDIDLIATPQLDITGGTESGPIEFEAICEVRPVITVPGYGGLRVELPSPLASDEEIEEAVEAERRRQGTLVDVDRPAVEGDHVTLTLAASREGELVPGLNTEDWLYEVGKGWVAEGFDDHLVGAARGAEIEFSANPSGTAEPADFAVTVSNVQEMQLPEIDDEWVADNVGEHDTVEEWRAAIAERISAAKLNQSRNLFVERTTSALAELVDAPLPDSMVQGDLQSRVQNTVQQFQQQGINIDQWLQATGQDANSFVEALRVQSEKSVKVDLALRAVAAAEGIEVTDEDLDVEYIRIGTQVRQKASQVKKAYEDNDAVTDLAAQLKKTKALDWLLEHVEVVDEKGAAIDRTLLMGEHDHDHDHDGHDHDHDGHDHDHAGHDHDHHDHQH
ncbi:MAG: trigger factor [Actinomycetota bacterium]